MQDADFFRWRLSGILETGLSGVDGNRKRIHVNKLCIFVAMTILGWVGWWIGSYIGFMTAYVVSGIGSLIGVYLGWRIHRDYLS